MPIARRKFQSVGQNGTIDILVEAEGGHVLSADIGVATSTASFILKPTEESLSDAKWTLPIAFGIDVPLIARPGQPAEARLPWIGPEPGAFVRIRLAMTIRSGSGAPTRNLNAKVSVSINGDSAKPIPIASMVFPGGLLPTPDVSRTTVVELIFER